jgi:hypothetical protein
LERLFSGTEDISGIRYVAELLGSLTEKRQEAVDKFADDYESATRVANEKIEPFFVKSLDNVFLMYAEHESLIASRRMRLQFTIVIVAIR